MASELTCLTSGGDALGLGQWEMGRLGLGCFSISYLLSSAVGLILSL